MKFVVFIDVQNDFVKKGVLAYGYPKKDIVPAIGKYAASIASNKEFYSILTRDTHERTVWSAIVEKNGKVVKGEPKEGYLSTLEGKYLPIEHCIKGTPGHNIADALDKQCLRRFVFDKKTFGSLELPGILQKYAKAISKSKSFKEKQIDEIQLCGFCTSICVISNAILLRAFFPNTKITILENLCGDINRESHEAALAVARNCQIEVKKAKA